MEGMTEIVMTKPGLFLFTFEDGSKSILLDTGTTLYKVKELVEKFNAVKTGHSPIVRIQTKDANCIIIPGEVIHKDKFKSSRAEKDLAYIS